MTEQTTAPIEFRDYLEILWRRKWIVVVAILVLTGVGTFRSLRQPKMYLASGTIALLTEENDRSAIDTEIRILEGGAVRDRVLQKVPGAGDVSAFQVGAGRIVSVAVQGPDAKVAVATVDAYVTAYIDYRREQQTEQLLRTTEATRSRIDDLRAKVQTLNEEFETRTAEIDDEQGAGTGESAAAAQERALIANRDRRELDLSVRTQRDSLLSDQLLLESKLRDLNAQNDLATPAASIINPASASTEPVSPKPVSDAMKAAAAGLILGIALAFLFEYLDDSIKVKEDVERALGPAVPVVATIPLIVEWRDKTKTEVVSLTAPRSTAAEAYRSLRTSVQFASLEDPVNVLAITSPTAGEGKTTALANLAVVVAGAGRRVVMLDCDLRRPRIHAFFGLPNDVGFTSWIIGDAPLSAALQEVPGVRRLSLMASGPIPPNPSELLSSRRFPELVKALQADGALVLIDTPPLLPVTDAAVIARSIDRVFMVTMAGKGTRKHLRQAVEILHRVDVPVAGVVLNRVEIDRHTYSYKGGYYGEGDTPPAPTPPPSLRRPTRRPERPAAAGAAAGNGRKPTDGSPADPARSAPRR